MACVCPLSSLLTALAFCIGFVLLYISYESQCFVRDDTVGPFLPLNLLYFLLTQSMCEFTLGFSQGKKLWDKPREETMESSETDRGSRRGSDKRAGIRKHSQGPRKRSIRQRETGAGWKSSRAGFIFVMSVVSWVARKFSILHSQICQPLPGF